MAQNTAPIFTLTPQISFASITTADTSTDGTGAHVTSICTANATNGSFIQKLVFQPKSTSGSTSTNAAAARIYINNGSTVGTAANNVLFKEVTLPSVAVNTAGTAAAFGLEVPLNIQLKAAYVIYVGITSMAANTDWDITAVLGDY